jgi:hypothetical protein
LGKESMKVNPETTAEKTMMESRQLRAKEEDEDEKNSRSNMII